MVNKLRVFYGNVLLTIMLVSVNLAWAQETSGEDSSTSGSGQITVPLSGTAIVTSSGSLSMEPGKLDTGLVDVGLSVTKTFLIKHIGGVDSPAVEITDAELFGKSASEFSSSFNGFTTLVSGESIEVSATFTPLTPGDKAAGLRLSIAGATTPYVMLFTGSARYPLTSDLGSSDGKLTFGQAIQNSNSQKNFILTNKGESEAPVINVSAIQLSGTNPDAFSVQFTPTTLQPGEQLDIKVDMSTGTVGYKSASAEVFHDGNNGSLEIDFDGTVVTPQSIPVNFTDSTLNTTQEITRGTTLQFGPGGKLYVGEMEGLIHVFNITRNGQNNYSGTLLETIDLIKNVQNHNDDGTLNYAGKRTMTGIFVTGTAGAPVIYVSSSDSRQAAGPSGTDSNLDTNSGIVHKLTKNGNTWSKLDLVRGLPRSEENHGPNGLVLVDNKIYLAQGGHTNMGVPSNNFAELSEYALSSAVLVIDLGAIGNNTYDLPTLNGPADQYDPFGGHDGLNQAKLVNGGPVQIFATGFRNPYDIVYTQSGRFYVWDNGPNTGWGGQPGGDCSNTINDDGVKHQDGLHLVKQDYYGGHPNPTRGNKGNTFGGQTPVEVDADPKECEYMTPGENDGALTINNPSTNGLVEYTATNFAGSMQGDLIAAAFTKEIYRVQLNNNGTDVTSKSILKNNLGSVPLDVTTQGDGDVFPGTIWVVDNIDKQIRILEPSDY